MRRILLIPIALLVFGCPSKPAEQPKPAPTPTPTPAPVKVTPADAAPAPAPPADAAPPDAALAAVDEPAGNDEPLKDIRILPKTWSRAQVVKVMKESIAPALGQKCLFCHVSLKDFAADHKNKTIAREMMTMTWNLNKTWFDGKQRITCMTCHKGKKEPTP